MSYLPCGGSGDRTVRAFEACIVQRRRGIVNVGRARNVGDVGSRCGA